MFKTYIMTFETAQKARRENAEYIAKQTNGEVYVGTTNACENFLNIFKLCSKDNCDLLFIEDDVVICKDFLTEVKKALNELPNQIIHFHHNDETNWGFTKRLSASNFHYTQCVYFPLFYINQYIKSYKLLCLKNKKNLEKNEYDIIFCRMLEYMNADFWSWFPRLVKNKNFRTELNHTTYVYNTSCFKDDLK